MDGTGRSGENGDVSNGEEFVAAGDEERISGGLKACAMEDRPKFANAFIPVANPPVDILTNFAHFCK